MGLRSIASYLKKALTAKKVYDRLTKEASVGRLKVALFALVGLVATAVVASITAACPDLTSSAGAIFTACIGGAFAFWMKRPKDNPMAMTLLVGTLSAAVAGGVDVVRDVCGTDFITKLPTLLTATVWTTLGLWLSSPREQV